MSLEDLLSGPAPVVAPLILGMTLVGAGTAVLLREVEAYTEDDPASHSHRGPTSRNQAMFGQAGTLYVYRSYGVHWCANVVTNRAGVGEAILLRGGTIVAGEGLAVQRRGRTDRLADGPGKLCAAMGISGVHDGSSLTDGPYRLEAGAATNHVATERIGISRGTERLWRFVAIEDPSPGH